MPEEKQESRKTKVTKHIGRKINTAKFETLEINISVEEEIEWTSLEEKMQKHAAVTKIAIKDYKETEAAVLTELQLGNKPASVTNTKPEGDTNFLND